MAAQSKEIIFNSNFFLLKNVCPDAAKNLFRCSLGHNVFTGFIRELHLTQRVSVYLAICIQWQLFHQKVMVRTHVKRQKVFRVLAELLNLSLRIFFKRNESNYVFAISTTVLDDNCDLSDLGMRQHSGLDFTRLDAKSADLYLIINPAEELQSAITPPTDPIAGLIQAITGHRAEEIRDKFVCGKSRTIEITASQSGAADAQLSIHSDRGWFSIRVQYIYSRIRDRPPDRDASGVWLSRAYPER